MICLCPSLAFHSTKMVSDGNMNVAQMLWYQKFVTRSRPSSWRVETVKIIDVELIIVGDFSDLICPAVRICTWGKELQIK